MFLVVMKYEWRKAEKELYLPPKKPVLVTVPCFKYYLIKGEGSPNSSAFQECIEALYTVSYAIRMSYKKGREPEGFYEYSVYPLEGFWGTNQNEDSQVRYGIKKDECYFTLMIRQPDFVTNEFSERAKEWAFEKNKNSSIEKLTFDEIEDGKCIQMLHVGSYDSEPESFSIMESFCEEHQLKRVSRLHKEIYLSDPRRVVPEKLKTVLRIEVK